MTMTLDEYQKAAERTAVYRLKTDLRWCRVFYASLGLAGEAGEVANEAKKIMRDDNNEITKERRAKLLDEAGDTLWYIAMICSELDMDLDLLARNNLSKLKQRHGMGVKPHDPLPPTDG